MVGVFFIEGCTLATGLMCEVGGTTATLEGSPLKVGGSMPNPGVWSTLLACSCAVVSFPAGPSDEVGKGVSEEVFWTSENTRNDVFNSPSVLLVAGGILF